MARLQSVGGASAVEFCSVTGAFACQTGVTRAGGHAVAVGPLAATVKAAGTVSFSGTNGTGPFFARAYVNITAYPTHETTLVGLIAGQNFLSAFGAWVTIDQFGTLRLYADSGLIGQSGPRGDGTTTLALNRWAKLEIHYDAATAAPNQSLDAQLDDVLFAASSSLTFTHTTGVRSVIVGGNCQGETATAGAWYVTDIAINDTTGTSRQVTFPGSETLYYLWPASPGDFSAWTVVGSESIAWRAVGTPHDKPTPDDVTTYLSCNTAATRARFNLETVPTGIGPFDVVNVGHVNVRNAGAAATLIASFHLEYVAQASGTVLRTASTMTPQSASWATNTSAPQVPKLTFYATPDGLPLTAQNLNASQIGLLLQTTSTNAAFVSALWLVVGVTSLPSHRQWAINRNGPGMGVSAGVTGSFVGTPPPRIDIINPSTGPAGTTTTVDINGANFLNSPVPTIAFGIGHAATGVTFHDPTWVSCTAPSQSAQKVDVILTNNDGQPFTKTLGFEYLAPAPSISRATPPNPNWGVVGGGTSVVITGTNFSTGSPPTVKFGGNAGAVGAHSAISITVTTPVASAGGYVDVQVINNPDLQSDTLTNGFYYGASAPTAPIPSQIAPNVARPDVGVSGIVISGSQFAANSTVQLGGVAMTGYTYNLGITPQTITATSGIWTGAVPSTVDVVVTNPSTGQSGSITGGFTYKVTAPQFTSPLNPGTDTPNNPSGITVHMDGDNFAAAPNKTQVVLGGNACTVNIVGPKKLTFPAPSHAAGTVGMTVTNPADGQAITVGSVFQYADPSAEFPMAIRMGGTKNPAPGYNESTATYWARAAHSTDYVFGISGDMNQILACPVANKSHMTMMYYHNATNMVDQGPIANRNGLTWLAMDDEPSRPTGMSGSTFIETIILPRLDSEWTAKVNLNLGLKMLWCPTGFWLEKIIDGVGTSPLSYINNRCDGIFFQIEQHMITHPLTGVGGVASYLKQIRGFLSAGKPIWMQYSAQPPSSGGGNTDWTGTQIYNAMLAVKAECASGPYACAYADVTCCFWSGQNSPSVDHTLDAFHLAGRAAP